MKTAALFLLSICLLAGCGGDNTPAGDGGDPLRERAKAAEVNLVKVRDAVAAYYAKHNKAPESVSDLAAFGIKEAELANEDYSELGYAFYNLEFDPAGKLTRGWLIATPMADREALKVRMNAVSGEFDYTGRDEDFSAAPSDNGWGNQPAANG
ncbi:MAG: hypothetical protein ICCCNLDF_00021 [Planctomycetes bacterium]|nr:hypothetical protein [Planctomycetota bacterium]